MAHNFALQFIVHCQECNDIHNVEKVEAANVEENIYGEDVFHFICPVTKNTSSSLVFRA